MADRTIKTGYGKDQVKPAAALLAPAFADNYPLRYSMCAALPDESRRLAYLPRFFEAILTAAALNGGSFDEIGDWQSCGVLMPPGGHVDNPRTLIQAGLPGVAWNIGVEGLRRMLFEHGGLNDASKKKCMKEGEPYYFIFFLGTRADARRQGHCSALVRHYQAIAAKENLPIWMDASTEGNMRLYEKLGFKVVDEVLLGKGKAAADGRTCKGGPGMKIWMMLWRPEWGF